jgi:hypothetical protein
MKRLIFLNRFFYPDHSATSQIVSDLSFHLAAAGADVHVITSQQLYDSPRASLTGCETVNGVHVHRVATTGFGRRRLWGRGLDYASYYGSMWRCARSLVREGDILVAKTDPPLASIFAMWVARRANARLVNWLQDIYPETAARLGVPFMRGPLGRVLSWLRDCSWRAAHANVAVGDHMAQWVLRSRGTPVDRVHASLTGATMNDFSLLHMTRIRCGRNGRSTEASSWDTQEISAGRTSLRLCSPLRSAWVRVGVTPCSSSAGGINSIAWRKM